jgi:hypothetical protein
VNYDEKQFTGGKKKKNLSSFYLYRFRKYMSYGFLMINYFNPGVHYETPCMCVCMYVCMCVYVCIYIYICIAQNDLLKPFLQFERTVAGHSLWTSDFVVPVLREASENDCDVGMIV